LPQAFDLAFLVAVWVTLWATAVGSGLSHRPSEVVRAASNGRRFVSIVVLNAVAIPLVVVALTRALAVPDGYAAGLIIVGAASAGSLGLTGVRIARADLPLAIGLIVVLEVGNVLTIPVWSTILLSGAVQPRPSDILATLILGVLLPLGVGQGIRVLRPARAQGWARGLALVSTVGFFGVVGLILWRDMADVIKAWDHLVPVVAMATVVVALFAGWAVGGPTRESRLSASLVTSVRSNTPALAVASATYGATSDAASAIVVFALTSLTISGFLAIWLGRTTSRQPG
jgi:BASS family bile acid:Na+ symporter